MAEEKEYVVLPEAKQMMIELVTRYPKELRAVPGERVEVLAVTNKDRPEGTKEIAKIRKIGGSYKALYEFHGIHTEYIIELYKSDWDQINEQKRQWLLMHELAHVPTMLDGKGMINHDVQDFAFLLDVAGLNWWEKQDGLPDLLKGEPVQFREELVERLHKKE